MSPSRVLPGLALAMSVALPATWLGAAFPAVGGPVIGIALGLAVGRVLRYGFPARFERCRPGLGVAARQVLQAAIVLMGFGLSMPQLLRIGWTSFPVMIGTLAVALAGAWLLGRALRLHPETSALIGVGTGICGASAIAAVTAVIRPAPARAVLALGTIFTFNIAAVAAYPTLGRLLGLSEPAFGLWAGTAINDTSSVVAAASSFGALATDHAVVVKLARSLMIVPICLALYAWQARRATPDGQEARDLPRWRAFPPFVAGFPAAALLASTGVVPAGWQPATSWLAGFLITVALAGIGLGLDVRQLGSAGVRPLVLGGLLGAAVGASSLGLQALTGRL